MDYSYQDPINYQGNNSTAKSSRHCTNLALIASDKAKYGTLCQHSDSKGWTSAHNCANENGKSYLCVQCGVAHCLVGEPSSLHEIKTADMNANRPFAKRRLSDSKMANASNDLSGHMESHNISASNLLPPAVLQQIADSGTLDEISNLSGAVRHHIYWHGSRNEADNTLRKSMLFLIYQTTRHGPQNGFRLCLIQKGFLVTSRTTSEDDAGDDIDRLEEEIPQGHMEVVVLGPKSPVVL